MDCLHVVHSVGPGEGKLGNQPSKSPHRNPSKPTQPAEASYFRLEMSREIRVLGAPTSCVPEADPLIRERNDLKALIKDWQRRSKVSTTSEQAFQDYLDVRRNTAVAINSARGNVRNNIVLNCLPRQILDK